MLINFPNRLDALQEQINRCTFWHFIRALQVLVQAPELVYSAEIGERFNIFLVPAIRLVLSIESVRLVQCPKN